MKKKKNRFQIILISLYVLTFCFCTTMETCPSIPELAMLFFTTIVIILEILFFVCIGKVKINAVQVLWIVFFVTIFLSIIAQANPLSLVALNLLAGLLFLLIPLNDYDSFGFAIKFLVIFGLIAALGVYLQLLFPSIWAPIYQFLTARSQYAAAEKLQYSIRYGGYGYLSGFCYNAGFTATYLVNGIIGTLISKQRTRKKVFAIVFMTVALVLTGKRGQFFALTVALMVAYPLSSSSLSEKANRFLKICGVIIAVYIVGYFLFKNYGNELGSSIRRVLSFIYEGEITYSGRDYYFEQCIELFLKKPIFGVGWRNLSVLIGNEPHNSYIQIATETGFFGIIIAVIVLIATFMHCLNHYKLLNTLFLADKTCKNTYYGVISFEIYFIVLSFVENTFCNIEFYYMFFLIVAMEKVYYTKKITSFVANTY